MILASASPRRKALLRQIGLAFEVIAAEVDERLSESELLDPSGAVVALAEAKARAVLDRLPGDARDALVIGADTVVLVEGRVLGKPDDEVTAADMLGLLSGRTHTVLTGVAVVDAASGRARCGFERTLVTMSALTDDIIRRYVATREPMDKAGAYAVQGLGSLFIERVEGCYFNVVGLPLALLHRLLVGSGFDAVDMWPPSQPLRCAGGARPAGVRERRSR